MDSKAFLAITITLNTAFILIGIYFISTYASTQSYEQYKIINEQGEQRFNESQISHSNQTNYMISEITHLNYRLDPILDQIPNATQNRIDQEMHYNQTTEDFNKIAQVLEIKLQDHITLGVMNESINDILGILNKTEGSNGTIIPVPVPVVNDNNGTVQPFPLPLPLANR